MKRSILLMLCSGAYFFAQAIPWGCDWWVRANRAWGTSHTSWNEKCNERSWFYPNGTPVPQADIQCCDFDDSGNYLGTGINCGFAPFTPKVPEGSEAPWDPPSAGGGMPPRPVKGEKRLHGNWQLDSYFTVGINSTGDVLIKHNNLSKNHVLFNLTERYGDKPVNVTTMVNKDMIQVIVTPIDGRKSRLDLTGSDYYTYNISEIKSEVYKQNTGEIVTLYPNPAKVNEPIKMTSTLNAQCVEIFIYSQAGVCVYSSQMKKEDVINLKESGKELYYYVLIIDGIKVNGGLIAVE